MFQVIYTSFGGSSKGLHFNNLIVGLVLLTRGRDEEKAKCECLTASEHRLQQAEHVIMLMIMQPVQKTTPGLEIQQVCWVEIVQKHNS